MYCKEDRNQIGLEEYFLPFEGNLDRDNRWVRLAGLMPWEHIEEIYAKSFSEDSGRIALPARIAFGAQYFLGLKAFMAEPLFDASMMVYFRKRFPVEEIIKINEYMCMGSWPKDEASTTDDDDDQPAPPVDGIEGTPGNAGKSNPNTSKKKQKNRKKNSGKLLMDATVAPADIRYPTDISLLNQCREIQEKAIELVWPHTARKGHKTPYNRKKARNSYLKIAKAKRHKKNAIRNAIGEQLQYVEQSSKRLEQLMSVVPEVQLPEWMQRRMEVIPKVCAQQKEMYDNHSKTCAERIVSLHQPHVRPIVRGKVPNPTEFGQKLHLSVVNGFTFLERTSWDNFNELAFIPRQFWRIRFTAHARTGRTARSETSAYRVRRWAAGERMRPRKNGTG